MQPPTTPSGMYHEVESLSKALQDGAAVLIDGDWFIEQAGASRCFGWCRQGPGRLLRRQDMERHYPEAVIDKLEPQDICRATLHGDSLHLEGGRTLIVVISYGWLAPDHPDKDGEQLSRIASMLRLLKQKFQGRVAIFMDYPSLYQKKRLPTEDEWTAEQADIFKRGLSSINLWYGHRWTHVWMLTEATTDRPYADRGWCNFEMALSSLNTTLVLEFGARCTNIWEMRVTFGNVLMPDEFDTVIANKSFTADLAGKAKTDEDLVKHQYREAHAAMFSGITVLDAKGLAWRDETVQTVVRSLLRPEDLQLVDFQRCRKLTDQGVKYLAECCRKLKQVDFGHCYELTSQSAKYLAECCHDLHQVNFGGCHRLSDRGVSYLARGCHNLQQVDFTDCYELTHVGVKFLAENCHNLKQVSFDGCRELLDRAVQYLAEGCRNLQQVNFRYCCKLTDQGVEYLAKCCRNLEQVCFDGCSKLTEQGVVYLAEGPGRHNMKRVNFGHCSQFADQCVKYLANGCHNLQQVDFACLKLTDHGVRYLAKSCPNLQQVNFHSCSALTDRCMKYLAEGCLGLQVVDLDYCIKLTDQGVQYLAEACHNLQQVHLGGCMELTDQSLRYLGSNCRNMEQVGFRFCNKLTDLGVKHLSEGCLDLQLVWLDRCKKLTDQGLMHLAEGCHKLQEVHCSGCTKVTRRGVRYLVSRGIQVCR